MRREPRTSPSPRPCGRAGTHHSQSAEVARLFLAIWPDAALRSALQQWLPGWSWPPSAAVVATARLHLTLHFIGTLAPARLAEVADGLRVDAEPFELSIGSAQTWPRGLAVIVPHVVPAALAALHGELRARLERAGLPVEERPFRPHVTLARRAAHARPPRSLLDARWFVASYDLVASRGGYETLVSYPLRRRGEAPPDPA